MSRIESDIREWAVKTFPDATPRSIVAHLNEESRELAQAVQRDAPVQKVYEEIGDVAMLLVHLARRTGTSLDICMMIAFEKARASTFKLDETHGYMKRVKPE